MGHKALPLNSEGLSKDYDLLLGFCVEFGRKSFEHF
ncbi:MAG: hypothetical protein QOD93_5990 [Acetobacteraceae bacterium]|jgi:hypothetical protein|nr:hypothetical protein [Acetobacteraceae bacterium]